MSDLFIKKNIVILYLCRLSPVFFVFYFFYVIISVSKYIVFLLLSLQFTDIFFIFHERLVNTMFENISMRDEFGQVRINHLSKRKIFCMILLG